MCRLRLNHALAIHVLLLWALGITAALLTRNSAFARSELVSGAGVFGGESGKIILLIGAMVLCGTITTILVHFLIVKHHVAPVTSLERSIGEILRGNQKSPISIPDPEPGFADLVAGINGIASELDTLRGQSATDHQQGRANIISRAILDAIPSPVFVLGDDGGVIQINPAAEKLSENLPSEGLLPAKVQHILEQCKKDHSQYMPQDPQDALVFRIHEEEVYFLPRIFHFDCENDSISGWAVLLHNVSRIRWLDDMKTNHIATVSHEIKTPLTCIRMVLLLLLEERSSQLDTIQRTLVTSASGDCERLIATVNSLLALSHAESGATNLNLIPLSLHACVEGLFEQFEKSASAQGLTLRIEGDDESFPKVLADPIRLTEVMENLVSNAINHSPEGGEIIIRITKPDAEHIRLSVIDQGAGVPEASQNRIFERFYRAPDQETKGLGLGLFISRDIMTAHEGRIGLLDRTDNLTEFFIDVPIA